MAHDPELADRLREALAAEAGVSEKRMFGGLAFLVGGKLAVSASGSGGLLLRVDPADTDALIEDEHAERFVMRGRPMAGWLRVDAGGLDDDAVLARWVDHGVRYARSLSAEPHSAE